MTDDTGRRLRSRLRKAGLSNAAITAAWPAWWSDEAASSPSARAELAFGVARRLGLDPRSLIEDETAPRFLWKAEARFKHLSGESDAELAGMTSFGRAVASILLAATRPTAFGIAGMSAPDLREQLLQTGRPFIELADLLVLSWSLGIPVVHLRVFPLPQKRMAAMTTTVGDRAAVLLGRDSPYPAAMAFYLAHELGHLALGQVSEGGSLIDVGDPRPQTDTNRGDVEEASADEFALALLTGEPRLAVVPQRRGVASASELARTALASGADLRIEPGFIAQCFGYSTGRWQTVGAAMRLIYPEAVQAWRTVNEVARAQLEFDVLGDDTATFLNTILDAGATAA